MPPDTVYLRPNVVPQPLFGQWYAWAHLIPPATAALNVVGRHAKIMKSYVQAPQIHAAAVANPAMLGGPFMDYGGGRVDEVRALLDRTLAEQAELVELAGALHALDAMLAAEAKGYSLEPLYARIPAPLRGYVELVYDLGHRPGYRLVEPLLYRSRFYDTRHQSLALSLIYSDHRPFVLSTPVLDDPDVLQLPIPFRSGAIDELFRMQRVPGSYQAIRERMEVPAAGEALFRSFFTEEPPALPPPYDGPGIRVRYFGHACILVETRELSILVDPVISYGYDAEVSRFTYADLPEHIDYVLITHNHQDHILLETMLQLRHKVGTIVVPRSGGGSLQDPSLKLMLEVLGFRGVVELGELEELPIPGGSIAGLPFFGEHSDLDIRTKLAYLVRTGPRSIVFAADSCNIEPELYRHVHAMYGDVDVLFLGMECDGAPLSWLYGPLLSAPLDRDRDHSRRLAGSNYERASDIVNRFGCKEVYVYAMGQEPWLRYMMAYRYTDESNPIIASNRLLQECRTTGRTAERLFGERELSYR